MFLPGFLLGLASCWHRGILKTFLAHPSILLLPAFTHYTFASSTKWCKGSSKEKGKEEDEERGEKQKRAGGGGGGGEAEEPFIVFSPNFTILNIILSIMGIITFCFSMTHIAGVLYFLWYYLYLPPNNIPFILVPILGLLLTLLSLVLTSTRQTCCSWPRPNCCSTCFTLPRAEHGALLAAFPHAHFVLDADGKPKLVPEDEEVKSEETEMGKFVVCQQPQQTQQPQQPQ